MQTHSTDPEARDPGATTRPAGGSLMDDLDAHSIGAPAKKTSWRRGPSAGVLLRPGDWPKRVQRTTAVAAAVLLIAGAVMAFFMLRTTPKPDYATAPMDEIFDFTLLTDDFNNLPIEERLEAIGMIVERVKTMSSSDSVLMAGFAATIEGELREQMMENASRVAIDVWDSYAADYDGALPGEREEYLEDALVDMSRTLAALAGEQDERTDEEIVEDAREQAERDQEAMASGEGPNAGQAARMMHFMRQGMGQHASGPQRARGLQMMRDMTRMLRGEGVDGGG